MSNMRRTVSFFLILISSVSHAQSLDSVRVIQDNRSVNFIQNNVYQDNRSVNVQANIYQQGLPLQNDDYKKRSLDRNIFNHLDASITLGTTGIGIDLASPVTNWAQLRVGYAFMPHFNYDMEFEIQVGDSKENKYDAQGNRIETKFDKMAAMLEDLTGYKVDDVVTMTGHPTYHNFKFLVDVFPFKNNKHWHVTAGFFWGPSKVATAFNKTEDMPSLLAVGIYNRLYENTMNSYEILQHVKNGDVNPATGERYEMWDVPPIISIGSIEIDGASTIESVYKSMANYGRMGVMLGKRNSDGSNYMMEPGSDGMVKADVRVNSFKPYLGIGYGGRLIKNNDRLHVAVDVGAMYWGKPAVITHDGTDLIGDIQKNTIGGKPGDYVKLARKFPILPVLDVRFVYSIF